MLKKAYLNTTMLIKGIKRTLRRIPVLKNIMTIIRKKEWVTTTSDHELKVYRPKLDLLKKHSIDISNKTIMDIGCGDNCLHAFEFLSSGAKEVILCEIWAKNYLTEEKIRARLAHKGIECFARFSKHLKVIDDSIENIKSIPDNSVDIIISNSLLEHVYDLDRAFSEMHRVLNKNGYMFHAIDLRDHFFFSYPLNFLRYSPWWWKNFYTKPETFTNRHRMPYYFYLANKYRFNIIHKYTESTELGTDRFGLHRDFKNYSEDENRAIYLEFIAKKL